MKQEHFIWARNHLTAQLDVLLDEERIFLATEELGDMILTIEPTSLPEVDYIITFDTSFMHQAYTIMSTLDTIETELAPSPRRLIPVSEVGGLFPVWLEVEKESFNNRWCFYTHLADKMILCRIDVTEEVREIFFTNVICHNGRCDYYSPDTEVECIESVVKFA